MYVKIHSEIGSTYIGNLYATAAGNWQETEERVQEDRMKGQCYKNRHAISFSNESFDFLRLYINKYVIKKYIGY